MIDKNEEKRIIIDKINRALSQKQIAEERKELNSKLYLGQIIELEKPQFSKNSLILAPVGSGKSHLIEELLIPKNYDKNIIYLTSNTALKDSVAPNNNKLRDSLAKKGKSIKFYTSENKTSYGDKPYTVHVMTYAEFGRHIQSPHQTFTNNIDMFFCDEIHSLPTYHLYNSNSILGIAMRWLFDKHEDKQIYYFTATKENLDKLEDKIPGYLSAVTTYNYIDHPKIRKYIANSTYLIKHIEQLRPHLKAKLTAFNYHGYKGLAFTKLISEQEKIYEIAKSEGFKPIILWSINNEKEMSPEQLRVRDFVLNSGFIPEPYNLLIINSSMQEGWDLEDDMMRLAILDTTDLTEQVQSLGRIRKDIDLVICKTNDSSLVTQIIDLPIKYLNNDLFNEDKESICYELNIIDNYGRLAKWPTVKKLIEDADYIVTDKQIMLEGKRTRVTRITPKELK